MRDCLASAFDNSPIGMALVAMDGRVLQVNDALCRITGLTAERLLATTLRALTHPDDRDRDQATLRRLRAGRMPSHQVEKRLRHADGREIWVQVTTSLVRDESRRPLYLVAQVQDVTDHKALERRLEYLVDHDSLTGTFTRRRFEQELAKEIDRVARYGRPGAVLVIDLDNFKDVNDTFGHKAGDEVLRSVATLLRDRLRQTDIVGRIGGDEFAVLLPETDVDRAQAVADDLVKALGHQTAVLADRTARVTASVGLSPLEGRTDAETLATADRAMYEAKDAGRNRVATFRPTADGRRGSARLAEAERVRRALEDGRLVLHAQPILDLADGESRRHELLLRIVDESGGKRLAPSAFLVAAERFGLISSIDAWVVREAARRIAAQARAGTEVALHVNLSRRTIGDRAFAAAAEEALDATGIDPSRLVFEVAETAAIANLEDARRFADRMSERGCRFALDDFGVGFASFACLKSLPIDFLKIDGGFIRTLVTSPVDRLAVEAVVGVARGAGKQTIAEFVADAETADLVRRIGVDFAQGFHIGAPRPVEEALPAEEAAAP